MFKKNNDGFGTIGAIIVLVIAVGLFIILGEGLNYSATETLGSATSPNGQVIESTSVYSRISYQVDGYFGVTVPAEKDKLVDIVKNN